MQVSSLNNVKIYNLSAGKSLPEWITERKRRQLQKNDSDIQRRIELIQDFDMPHCSTNIKATPDGQYIYAFGNYKPRMKCYDVSQLSMKFERYLDADVVQFDVLSKDYSKLVLLRCDRYVEFQSQRGQYYLTRIPKYGRDMAYHYPSCDMYFAAAGPEIYRLNMELGRFMTSLKTNSEEVHTCEFNPVHHLFACGTNEGHLECWDPRTRNRVGRIDCAMNSFMQQADLEGVPAITKVKHRDALTIGVGTSTGQVLLYDLRSDKPILMKDHNYGLPIKSIEFHDSQDLVLSTDCRILKIWERNNGKAYTSIEPGTVVNDLCLLKDTGLLFMANEDTKIQTYYIPSLGPAPKWASFLDNLTEELEENPAPSVYDDYKFATRTEVESLGLSNLIGSNLLKAYMHGYFMNIRLYKKAKSMAEPFAYDEYRKNKVREKIDEERANRVKLQKKLPKVNRQLAEKLLEQEQDPQPTKKKSKAKPPMPNLMKDDRFSAMFADPDYQVDVESEQYRLLNPLVSKIDRDKQKRQERRLQKEQERIQRKDEVEADVSEDDDSSEDERTWTKEVQQQHKLLKEEDYLKRQQEEEEVQSKPSFYEMDSNVKVKGLSGNKDSVEKKQMKSSKRSLGERVEAAKPRGIHHQSGTSMGNMELTFSFGKKGAGRGESKHRKMAKEHHEERRKIRRSAGDIVKKQAKSKYWTGKRF